MLSPKPYFTISPLTSPGASALAYVPFVIIARAMAFLRTLVVAAILGATGQYVFGLYQPALELVNPLVALVLFGAADVAERYVSHLERTSGHAGVKRWLLRQWLRITFISVLVAVLMTALGPWISHGIWGEPAWPLVIACAAAMIVLALYQHLAAVLRGLRAYAAAAGMEILSAFLLLLLSALAALTKSALPLMAAYILSVTIPLVLYAVILWIFLHRQSPPTSTESLPAEDATAPIPAAPLDYAPQEFPPGLSRFAAWALVRLLLVTTFGFLSLWGVRYLAQSLPLPVDGSNSPLYQTAQYAMPFRIAQLLAFVAVTAWASSYGLSARAWSHGQVRRARMQFFRVGRFGAAALALIAVGVLLFRGLFKYLLPAYATALDQLLPGLLALFFGYALLAFSSTYADLQESPQKGAALWGVAVATQLVAILLARFTTLLPASADAGQIVLFSSAIGIGLALLLAVPLLCRPIRFSATGVPLIILALASLTLFTPEWVVDYIAPPILLAAVVFLYMAGLLIRPIDRRAFRRWQKRNTMRPA